jgi:hypothetical protein
MTVIALFAFCKEKEEEKRKTHICPTVKRILGLATAAVV